MANILGIFTAIILAVAAFVAAKNKTRLADEIVNRDTELQSLSTSQDRLLAAQKVLAQLPIDRAEIDAQAAVKTEEETKLKESNDATKSQIETKNAKISSNTQELEETREKLSKAGNIADLAGKMETMSEELGELDQSITDNEATLANLTAQNTTTLADATTRKKELDNYSKGESLASLKTRIRSIYPAWGFVTLADGNNGGVLANSILNVVRGDETVARLLVTAVESRSATATIIPDSVGEDVVLMVGDRVVPGSKDEKKEASN
jgi:hypothetical protein